MIKKILKLKTLFFIIFIGVLICFVPNVKADIDTLLNYNYSRSFSGEGADYLHYNTGYKLFLSEYVDITTTVKFRIPYTNQSQSEYVILDNLLAGQRGFRVIFKYANSSGKRVYVKTSSYNTNDITTTQCSGIWYYDEDITLVVKGSQLSGTYTYYITATGSNTNVSCTLEKADHNESRAGTTLKLGLSNNEDARPITINDLTIKFDPTIYPHVYSSTLPSAVVPGYSSYWSTSVNGSEVENEQRRFAYKNPYESDTHNVFYLVSNQISYYKVTLDNTGGNVAPSPSTIYYKYGYSGYPDGSQCMYFTNSNLNTCISKRNAITIPQKTGYVFKGYYTGENGQGEKFIDESGNIVNNLFKYDNNNNTDIVLYPKWELPSPATPTITGGEAKVWGASDTTLTCNTSTTYSGNIDLYYSFGYSNTDGGTPSSWTSASTTKTLTINKYLFVGARYYSCRVYAIILQQHLILLQVCQLTIQQ